MTLLIIYVLPKPLLFHVPAEDNANVVSVAHIPPERLQ